MLRGVNRKVGGVGRRDLDANGGLGNGEPWRCNHTRFEAFRCHLGRHRRLGSARERDNIRNQKLKHKQLTPSNLIGPTVISPDLPQLSCAAVYCLWVADEPAWTTSDTTTIGT